MSLTYCPQPKEITYHNVDYKSLSAIKGLLRFYIEMKTEIEYKPNFELLCVLTDISNAIKNIKLTNQQRKVLALYMNGWTEESIGKDIGITKQGVNKHLKLICKKMSIFLEGIK